MRINFFNDITKQEASDMITEAMDNNRPIAKYGCKKCGMGVFPVDGKLTCCNITENKPSRDRCKVCGGVTRGFSDDYFVMGCHCDELSEAACYYDAENYGDR